MCVLLTEMATWYDQLSVQTDNWWIFRAFESLYYHSAVNKLNKELSESESTFI